MTKSQSIMLCTVAGALATSAAPSVHAADVIAEWASVKTPPAPELKPVTVDAKTTALLILDINKPACTLERRPRCVDTLPHIKTLLDAARAAGAPVFYTFSGTGDPALVADPSLASRAGEAVPAKGPDKLLNSDLVKKLRDKGVQTVIVTGSTANGAVIGSAGGAAMRGFKVVVPVDGMSADSVYIEQYVAWHIANAPVLSTQSTLTRSDMIKF